MGNSYPWFKLYVEIIYDPKIRRLTSDEKWLWIVLLCLVSQRDDRHIVCVTDNVPYEFFELYDLCSFDHFEHKMDKEEFISKALKKFSLLGMIEFLGNKCISVKNFKKRQDSILS